MFTLAWGRTPTTPPEEATATAYRFKVRLNETLSPLGSSLHSTRRSGLPVGVKLDLIVQAINQGAPAADGNFEMLLGDGGFTGNQACIIGSGANVPMYPGNASMW